MNIESLQNVCFDKIFDAFSSAFEDYELQLNKVQLKTMLSRRGFAPQLSFAAFEGDHIVAFTLNGIGMFHGTQTAYDTGTGTVKEFRGRGLASEIFEYSMPFLKNAGIKQYLLEVLQHNTKAVSVYQKLGFEVNRELNYFVQKNEEVRIRLSSAHSNYAIRQIELNQCKKMQDFWDFCPSWQNSFEAIDRKPDDFLVFGAFIKHEPAGYCIFEPNSGDIAQLAVDRLHRRKGVASLLLSEALKSNVHDSVKIINSDVSCSSVTGFSNFCNIPLKGKQFEMIRKIG
jgi:ribosomal protein S18 acetylase RimI-like enzyme